MLGRELFRVVEGVLVVGVGIIRHFGDRNARFHVWTVIADENNERALRPAHIGKRVGFSFDALARKVMRFQPKSQILFLISPTVGPRQHKQYTEQTHSRDIPNACIRNSRFVSGPW